MFSRFRQTFTGALIRCDRKRRVVKHAMREAHCEQIDLVCSRRHSQRHISVALRSEHVMRLAALHSVYPDLRLAQGIEGTGAEAEPHRR